MHPDPNSWQLTMDSIKFFCWVIGSICSLGITLMGIYLKMYIREVLHEHAEVIRDLVAENYVRKDVYVATMRGLEGRN